MRAILIAAPAALFCAACAAPAPPPAAVAPPPAFVLEPCLPWPELPGGDGPVTPRAAVAAVGRAKEAHASCERRAQQAQQYIRMVTGAR